MASYLPPHEPPRHSRHSLIFSGLPAVEQPGSTAHVSGSRPRYYGREDLAKLCANWLKGVFGCPDVPEPSQTDPANFRPKPLKDFIEHILRRLRADSAVTFCALYTLNRLKEAQPGLVSKSGHALFFAAFVVAGKVLPDIAYSNKNLASITEGMFPLRVTNHLERDFLEKLNWVVRPPDVETAKEFEEQVRKHYSDGPRPWTGPSRRHPAAGASTPVATNDPHHNVYPYPVHPRRATESPSHPSSQPQQHTYPPAPATHPPLRANTALPATSSATQSSRQARRYPNTPHSPPALFHTAYDSDSSSATPSPVTPEEYQDPRARAAKSRQAGMRIAPGDHGSVRIPGDASFGSVAPRNQRTARVQDIYAHVRH